ncbi:protein-export membrane protein, SecD/SecF family [Owenweeksia hongkongensis DSM 17368]|uniref:Multifunctional fusion protein n=1 Tax=Owenweeksia hongkongensis (strain DSM 17368 / CIP 108786 / JCM 12287 / NRRL B-23963 / UST20020801) TaxID=926562 RepID=G8R861_OWEHD|nr:protein translocase subunit SecDF [Owenweeksia hongkongensis]AEV32429.1 protein-export membrane protein, SecD/SecF family [Owenweeksia hongkongensis DSM 17368]
MQNKGVIRLFAIVFALACLYQLSFTYIAGSVEKDAEEYANGDYEKEQRYLDSMGSEEAYDVLLEQFTYQQVKEREINLGLDLRGGMNVILEVQVRDILIELANNSKNSLFRQAIDKATAAAVNSQQDYLSNFFDAFEEVKAETKAATKLSDPQVFGTKEMNDKLGFNAEDEAVKEELRSEVNAAVENVYTVLRARIDQFGVVQPNIQRLENGGRILVELPGVKDPDRVKKLLQSTAELEFWNLYDTYEMAPFINAVIEKVGTVKVKGADSTDTETASNDILDEIQSIDDSSNVVAEGDSATGEDGVVENDSAIAGQTYSPFLRVFAPNLDEQNRFQPGPIIGFVAVKDTAKVNAYLRDPKIKSLLTGEQRYTRFFYTAKSTDGNYLYLLAAKGNREGTPALAGDVVTDARQDFDQGNSAVVSMSMNAVGAREWAKITKEASSQEPKKSVAVVLDNYVYSFPTVQGEIPTGNTQITGNFTVQEAQDLANKLKAGKLPVAAKIIQADIVGPSLGQEAISAGLWSFVVALGIVMLYMIFYYSGAGIASDLALIVNMFFIFGILASLGAVLTLPGIAGIVLTIGMAVDANVLIYERIREELAQGKGLKLAIKDGYGNAYSSIIDANVTTFLTGVILYLFGTGPIRGFATTLIIGILTSLFCAIFITRLIFEARLDKKKSIAFSTGMTANAFKKFKIDFLSKRKIAYAFSAIIIIAGIGSLATRGLNYGVDFVGGRSYQVRFDQPVSSVDVSSKLATVFVDEDGTAVAPEVKTIGGDNQVVITTKYKIDETGTEINDEIKDKLYEGLKGFYAETPNKESFSSEATGSGDIGIVSERQVGPTIADDIKTSAFWAILFSLVVIFIYILIRFSKWQFSLGAVSAAFHDVLIVLSVFSILYGFLPFSLEIDQAFIAAVLTVIGYSLNDTVVVFDRIREYLATHSKKKDMNLVVNDALNSTLSRTINTSLTTFFVLLVIFLFGGEAIRGFMFALLIGVVVGTYSSLFIATPLMMDTSKKRLAEEAASKKRPVEQPAS